MEDAFTRCQVGLSQYSKFRHGFKWRFCSSRRLEMAVKKRKDEQTSAQKFTHRHQR